MRIADYILSQFSSKHHDVVNVVGNHVEACDLIGRCTSFAGQVQDYEEYHELKFGRRVKLVRKAVGEAATQPGGRGIHLPRVQSRSVLFRVSLRGFA